MSGPEQAAVERHVVVITPAGSFTATGDRLTGPVDAVDKLEKLIDWAHQRGGLRALPAEGEGDPEPARLWLVGGAGALLAGDPAGVDVTDGIGQALAPLVTRGWELSARPTRALMLSRGQGAQRICVEVLAESEPWLAAGQQPVFEDAAELGRRLRRWYATLGVLPGTSAVASAAVLSEGIMRARTGRRGAVVTTTGALPAWVQPEVRIQPTWCASSAQVEQQFERSDELVCLTQQCPQLASAGMLTLGYGQPQSLDAAAAVNAVAGPKRPFGVWRATLPAGDGLALPEMLPLPHPHMRPDHAVQAWLSTEDLDGLTKDVRDGGAGLTIEQLDIDEAIVWPQQGRILEAWATRLREARETFRDESTLQHLVESAAAGYITALADPRAWDEGLAWRRHFQPAWTAAISAHTRFRGRRAAMRIAREYRSWPVYLRDADMLYTPGRDDTTGAPIDLADTHTRLGRLEATRRAELTDRIVLAVLLAESTRDVAAAFTEALGLDEGSAVKELAAAPTTDAEAEVTAGSDTAPTLEATNEQALHHDSAADKAEENGEVPDTTAPAAPRPRRSGRQAQTPLGGAPAAVLHTDGLWLGDGSCVATEPIRHVGQIAQLAYDHDLGYRLSEKFSEPGQIWLSVETCEAVGIDVEAIDFRDSAKSLRALTKGTPFIELAIEDGWRFGGVAEGEQSGLGTWTRVYRDGDDKRGVWVVLTAGLGDTDAMPIFAEDPTPAQVARRLQILADALKFPWKINGGVTAVDLMLQARPKTWSPADWKNVVLAPSTTEVPFSMGDVESDFNWSREPTNQERELTYLHAYDRGGSYVAGIAGTELPIGDPVHHPSGVEFDPKVPGYYLTVIPDPEGWQQPYVLNPRGLKFNEPKWVCTPRIERALAMGYEPEILEAWTWPQHGRVLLGWYERFRDASTNLDTEDPDFQAARNQTKIVRVHGIGIIGSAEYLKGRPGFSPERRLHVMAKANANISYRINDIGQRSGRWPLAVLKDTVFYASDDADSNTAWPGAPKTFGRGFGQYKPERSGLLVDQLRFLTGRGYQGKAQLTPIDHWRREHNLSTHGNE